MREHGSTGYGYDSQKPRLSCFADRSEAPPKALADMETQASIEMNVPEADLVVVVKVASREDMARALALRMVVEEDTVVAATISHPLPTPLPSTTARRIARSSAML